MATAKKTATRTLAKAVAVPAKKEAAKKALTAAKPASTSAEKAHMKAGMTAIDAESKLSRPTKEEKTPAKKATAKKAVKPITTASELAAQDAIKKAVKAEAPAKQTKEEKAAEKLAELERNELLYRATSVLVPIWFGNANAEKVMKQKQLSAEEALCVMFIGSTPGGASEKKIRMNLHMHSNFNRREAMLIGLWGMSSLEGHKLGKWVGNRAKLKTDDERDSQNMVLTAKGQLIYDTARKSILSGFEPKRALKHTYF